MKRLMATLLLKRLQSYWLFAAGGVLKRRLWTPLGLLSHPFPDSLTDSDSF